MVVEDELVTGSEIGRRLGVSRQRVYQWLKAPNLRFPKPLRLNARIVLWRWADVERWVASRRQEAKR